MSVTREEYLAAWSQLDTGGDKLWSIAGTIRAYVDQLITPEECKRRCFAAADRVAQQYGGKTPQADFNNWYAREFEEGE